MASGMAFFSFTPTGNTGREETLYSIDFEISDKPIKPTG
jgi:hypothetical protein